MPYSALGPRPQMALTLRSIDSEGNLRVDVFPEDVQQEEFNIVIKTWGDGVLLQVFVTWIAFD